MCALTLWHMYDFNCQTKENKLRRFFVDHYDILEDLLKVKQADYSGCMDDRSTAPTVARWKGLLARMRKEGAPLTLKQLAVGGQDLLYLVPAPKIATTLKQLLYYAACYPKDNVKEKLLQLLPR